jgi:hypothetical protein
MALYLLRLNDMRSPQIEIMTDICVGTHRDLKEFIQNETDAPYTDRGGSRPWHKTFRKGGPLEWFNPPSELFGSFVQLITIDEFRACNR